MQVNGQRVLPARRAGLIPRGTSRPSEPVNVSNQPNVGIPPVEGKELGHQRQKELVDRIMAEAETVSPDEKLRYLLVADKLLGCGNIPLPGIDTDVRKSENGRYIRGMCHCSKGICPICLPYQDAVRAEKLRVQAGEVVKLGLRNFLFTVTIRHYYGAKFKELLNAERKMWAKTTGHRRWKEAVAGMAWKFEVGFTAANGHHPHKHCIVSLREGVDEAEFVGWLKQYWEIGLKKLGRSCDWKSGWWQVIPKTEDIDVMVGYIFKSIREVTGTSYKHNAPWLLPVAAYVEIFLGSRNMRFFGMGGCWKSTETTKCEEEGVLEGERKAKDPVLTVIPTIAWRKFTAAEKYLIKDVVYDKQIDDEHCVEVINTMVEMVMMC